ncbi:MAG TPA: DUF1329 domain-containing protein [Candidatus Limnocylindrales bacterium]|nr:DUF1329 domain-containing protein [Candidatus Limnocylindrales bacterium]
MIARIGFFIVTALLVFARVDARAEIVTSPLPSASASPSVASELKPGTVISADNVGQYARYVPAAGKFAVAHGFRMRVIPERRVEWSQGFQHATEKYAAQVSLDSDGYIKNYIAGMPFPLIDATDSAAATKIAYNWHMGPFMPDDFSIAPWSSNAYASDPANALKIVPNSDRDYACEQFEFLRFAHRTDVDPRPTIGDNAMGVEWKAKCSRWAGDFSGTASEGAGIWVRYLDAKHPDEFFSFNEASRRVRRSAVNLAYPNESCRGCHQPFWAYALPKTENYQYRLLGTTVILACLAADDEPAGFKSGAQGLTLGEEPFELRHAYILEMRPRFPEGASAALRTVVYIDSEVYVWLAAEFYDSTALTASAIPLWRMRPSSEGGSLFDLAGSFYRPESTGSFFRSLVPAHNEFQQVINSGGVTEGAFNPLMMH